MKVKQKQSFIDAIQFTEVSIESLLAISVFIEDEEVTLCFKDGKPVIKIWTYNRTVEVGLGDWLLKSSMKEFSYCKSAEFDSIYEII